jgi:hypothetical protein
MSAIHPAVAVMGLRIIATTIVATTIVTSTTVSIVGVASVISTIVSTIAPTVVSAVAIIWTIVVSVTEAHAPSRVAKSHADTPAKWTSGIPVHIGVIGIIIIPTIIVIGKSPQIGRVVIVSGIGIIVIINNNRGARLAILAQGIILKILLCIKCFTSFRSIIFPQHFRFLL